MHFANFVLRMTTDFEESCKLDFFHLRMKKIAEKFMRSAVFIFCMTSKSCGNRIFLKRMTLEWLKSHAIWHFPYAHDFSLKKQKASQVNPHRRVIRRQKAE